MRKGKAKIDRRNLHPTAKVKTRVPWIPPGKASIRDASYKWEVMYLQGKLYINPFLNIGFLSALWKIYPGTYVVLLKLKFAPRGRRTALRSHRRCLKQNLNLPSLPSDWLTSHQKKRKDYTGELVSMRGRLTAYWQISALWRMRSVSGGLRSASLFPYFVLDILLASYLDFYLRTNWDFIISKVGSMFNLEPHLKQTLQNALR